MKKPGPKRNENSLKNRAKLKAFYVEAELWQQVCAVAENTGKEKSVVLNEAIQIYLNLGTFNEMTNTNHYGVVSLFSGCGGMDLGFAGGFVSLNKEYPQHLSQKGKSFKLLFANDLNSHATDVYKDYFLQRDPESLVFQGDIKNYLDELEETSPAVEKFFPVSSDVLIGGFPCQDFSVAGKRKGFTSERGLLYQQMIRAAKRLSPKIFVAENVKGLTNLGDALKTIKEDFAKTGKTGYRIFSKLHHAADFGVPQTRERVFIVGIRKDLDPDAFSFPFETHASNPDEEGLRPWVSARNAIGDLIDKGENIPNQSQYSKAKNYGEHCQGNRKIKADYPSPTIRAEHHGNIEFHYSLPRRLSVRECARIQSFPDDFVFRTSASAAYKMIGNAVPPVLGWHIANAVMKALSGWER